jgi:hypothetical protein
MDAPLLPEPDAPGPGGFEDLFVDLPPFHPSLADDDDGALAWDAPPAERGARGDPGHLPPLAPARRSAAAAPPSSEEKRQRQRVYQRRYQARRMSRDAQSLAERAAALEAARAAAAAAAAERAALLERGAALSALVGYAEDVAEAFAALRAAPAAPRPAAAAAPGGAADPRRAPGEEPAHAAPFLRARNWSSGIEAVFLHRVVPSDALIRAAARLAPTGRIADAIRFSIGRAIAALAVWETAPPAGRRRAEAVLEAFSETRRRFLVAVLAAGRARVLVSSLAPLLAPPGDAAAVRAAMLRLRLAPSQLAALCDAHDQYCCAVKGARAELRAALACAADAAAATAASNLGAPARSSAPGADVDASAAAARAARAAQECAEAEAVAVVEVAMATAAVLTPVQLATAQRDSAPYLVDIPRFLDAVAGCGGFLGREAAPSAELDAR